MLEAVGDVDLGTADPSLSPNPSPDAAVMEAAGDVDSDTAVAEGILLRRRASWTIQRIREQQATQPSPKQPSPHQSQMSSTTSTPPISSQPSPKQPSSEQLSPQQQTQGSSLTSTPPMPPPRRRPPSAEHVHDHPSPDELSRAAAPMALRSAVAGTIVRAIASAQAPVAALPISIVDGRTNGSWLGPMASPAGPLHVHVAGPPAHSATREPWVVPTPSPRGVSVALSTEVNADVEASDGTKPTATPPRPSPNRSLFTEADPAFLRALRNVAASVAAAAAGSRPVAMPMDRVVLGEVEVEAEAESAAAGDATASDGGGAGARQRDVASGRLQQLDDSSVPSRDSPHSNPSRDADADAPELLLLQLEDSKRLAAREGAHRRLVESALATATRAASWERASYQIALAWVSTKRRRLEATLVEERQQAARDAARAEDTHREECSAASRCIDSLERQLNLTRQQLAVSTLLARTVTQRRDADALDEAEMGSPPSPQAEMGSPPSPPSPRMQEHTRAHRRALHAHRRDYARRSPPRVRMQEDTHAHRGYASLLHRCAAATPPRMSMHTCIHTGATAAEAHAPAGVMAQAESLMFDLAKSTSSRSVPPLGSRPPPPSPLPSAGGETRALEEAGAYAHAHGQAGGTPRSMLLRLASVALARSAMSGGAGTSRDE